MEQFLKNYSREAMGTAIYPNVGNNLHYATMAVMDEWGEVAEMVIGKTDPFTEKQLKHEIGDLYWETNALIFEMGLNFSDSIFESGDMFVVGDHPTELIINAGLLISKTMGRLKKVERDGDTSQLIKANIFLVQYLAMLNKLVYFYGFELEDILQMNLDKLSDRKDRDVLGGDGDDR